MKEPKAIESVPIARWSDGRKVLVFGLKFLDRIPIHEGDELEFRYYGNKKLTIEYKPDADMPKIVIKPQGLQKKTIERILACGERSRTDKGEKKWESKKG